LGAGLVAGLALGGFFTRSPMHAVATDHSENFTIATGAVDDELEAVFVLDFLSGSLKAAVLSTSTGRFTSMYETNVMNDLGVNSAQNPKFLMVTGTAGLRKTGANIQPGNAVVYVTEVTTGRVAAYAVPWTRGQATATSAVRGALYKLDVLQFRAGAIH
jgi:hypothetical protein